MRIHRSKRWWWRHRVRNHLLHFTFKSDALKRFLDLSYSCFVGTPMVVTSVARQVVQSQPTPPLAAPVPPSLVPTSNTRDGATTDIVLNSGIQNNSPAVSNIQQNGSQIQIINSGVLNNAPAVNQNGNDKNKTQNGTSKVVATSKPVVGSIYLCEWRGCMRLVFANPWIGLH